MSELKKSVAGNPLLILLLGACTAMGATTTLLGAVTMGVAALIVMVLSALVINALKKASNDYMDESLRKTEEVIADALANVRDTRMKFRAVTEAQEQRSVPNVAVTPAPEVDIEL